MIALLAMALLPVAVRSLLCQGGQQGSCNCLMSHRVTYKPDGPVCGVKYYFMGFDSYNVDRFGVEFATETKSFLLSDEDYQTFSEGRGECDCSDGPPASGRNYFGVRCAACQNWLRSRSLVNCLSCDSNTCYDPDKCLIPFTDPVTPDAFNETAVPAWNRHNETLPRWIQHDNQQRCMQSDTVEGCLS